MHVIPPLGKSRTSEVVRAIQESEFMSVQFDGWQDRANRRFIGVMSHVLHKNTFTVCHLATIPVDSLHADGQFLANHVNEVLVQYECSPLSSVTDTDSTEQKAMTELNRLRGSMGLPQMAWMPCICHLLNLVLREFCERGEESFRPMKALQRTLSHSAVFSYFCQDKGLRKTTIPELNTIRWSSVQHMVDTIVDLAPVIREYALVNNSFHVEDKVFLLATQLKPLLDQFIQLLTVMEADSFGNITKVFCTFAAI
jgi:hypothetical protein